MVRWILIGIIVALFLIGNYIYSDIPQALDYYGNKIFPNHPEWGRFLILGILISLIFTDDIFGFIKNKSARVKLKKNL